MYRGCNLLAVLAVILSVATAQAQVGCIPNPNVSGPPFIDGCPIPAAGLNKIPTLPPVPSWVNLFWPNTTVVSAATSTSPIGAYGLIGASRSSDNVNLASIAVAGFNENNNTTNIAPAADWAAYFEADRSASVTTTTLGVEIDVGNNGSVVTPDPYHMHNTGFQTDLWLACGGAGFGGVGGSNPCSSAIGITNNTRTFQVGIVFDRLGLSPGGIGGNGMAIEMADLQSIKWFNGTTNSAEIYGNTAGGFSLFCNSQVIPPTMATSIDVCTNMTGSLSEVNFINTQVNAGGFTFLQKNSSTTTYQVLAANMSGIFPPILTVSTLPACAAASNGAVNVVTDASNPTYNALLAGGGSTTVLALCNGANWTAH